MFHYLEFQPEWLRTNTDKHKHPNLEVYNITDSWTHLYSRNSTLCDVNLTVSFDLECLWGPTEMDPLHFD